jgi:hypothetical protein
MIHTLVVTGKKREMIEAFTSAKVNYININLLNKILISDVSQGTMNSHTYPEKGSEGFEEL